MFSIMTRSTEWGTPGCDCGEAGSSTYVVAPEGDAPPDNDGGTRFVAAVPTG